MASKFELKPVKLIEKKKGYWIEFQFGGMYGGWKNLEFYQNFVVEVNEDFTIQKLPKKYKTLEPEIQKLVIDNKIRLLMGKG